MNYDFTPQSTLPIIFEDSLSTYVKQQTESAPIQELDRTLREGGYTNEIGSLEYLPPKFFGIDTRLFGSSFVDDNTPHPFIQLKQLILSNSLTQYDDKFQCIKYMIHIPYINAHQHCLEACQTILQDESIEVNKRHYFFANNDKYAKLNDNLVYDLHPFFFTLGKERKYPLMLLLLTCRFIISFYPLESEIRDDVLEFILDIADNKNEAEHIRAECADILYSIGVQEEVIYGMKILQELGHMDQDLNKITLYSNTQNVHDSTIQDSVRKIIRTLHKEYLQNNTQNNLIGNCSLEYLHKLITDEAQYKHTDRLQEFFTRLMTDPTRFEGLNLVDVFILIVWKISTFSLEIKSECYKRLIEEIIDSQQTCHTGYVSRLVNVLSGFVEGDEYMLTMDPKDELRSAVFARLNASISVLPTYLKDDVLNSLWSDDKSVFQEFYNMYSPEEELQKEYQTILKPDEFKIVYEKAIRNFQSL
jgi:hypothetical protein